MWLGQVDVVVFMVTFLSLMCICNDQPCTYHLYSNLFIIITIKIYIFPIRMEQNKPRHKFNGSSNITMRRYLLIYRSCNLATGLLVLIGVLWWLHYYYILHNIFSQFLISYKMISLIRRNKGRSYASQHELGRSFFGKRAQQLYLEELFIYYRYTYIYE